MARGSDKKRKLDQDQADITTPKRLKPTQSGSSKRAGPIGSVQEKTTTSKNGTPTQQNGIPQLTRKEKRHAAAQNGGNKPAKERGEQIQNQEGSHGKQNATDTTGDSNQPDLATTPESKRAKKRKSLQQNGTEGRVQQTAAGADDEDIFHKPASTKAQGALIPAADVETGSSVVAKVKAGAQRTASESEALVPNANGWRLSEPSAGRYIAQDPIFVGDQSKKKYIIAATAREVQLLSLSDSLVQRKHVLPAGRRVVCFTKSTMDQDGIDIAYDNGTKVQWSWATGIATTGTFPGQEHTVAMTTADMRDSKPEVFYVAERNDGSAIIGERKELHWTPQLLKTIQVLHTGAYIVCTSPTMVVIGARKDNDSQMDYDWIEVPFHVPIRCADARLVNKNQGKGKADKHRPQDLSLAVGNVEGQIHLYTNLSSAFSSQSRSQLTAPRILHWHREPVSSVKFSRDGNYLISGGRETVLVIWQLETGHKQYLPHLTAEVERIVVSHDGSKYALQMGDNSIMVLSTSELKPIANFAGLQLPALDDELVLEPLTLSAPTAVLHPRIPHHLLLSVPPTQPKIARDLGARPFLQTFDVRNSRHISRQALTRNNVTDFNLSPDQTPIVPPDVYGVAITADGQWMATVDDWIVPGSELAHSVPQLLDRDDLKVLDEEQARRREVHLKFWRWDKSQEMWTLSNRVISPHGRRSNEDTDLGAGTVLKLITDPSSNTFATVGEDSVVKIWKPKTRTRQGVDVKEEDGTDSIDWVCKRTIPLPAPPKVPERADSPMEEYQREDEKVVDDDNLPDHACIAFSEDGSMLACAETSSPQMALTTIHFIETSTGIIKFSRTGLVTAEQRILDFGFLGRYFISLSNRSIRVWNLLDDKHMFTIILLGGQEADTEPLLAINQFEETFAMIVPGQGNRRPKLGVFGVKNNFPLMEVEFSARPLALLATPGASGYTILFEDGTIRSVSTSARQTAPLDPGTVRPKNDTFALPSVEVTSALSQTAPEGVDEGEMLALSSGPHSGRGTLEEDDRTVWRPEQLNAIVDSDQTFAMQSVTDMFQALGVLASRKPRRQQLREGAAGDAIVLA